MRILVHLCCGPCGITVLQRLLDAGHELAALFFNPNIQPLSEYMRRREGAMRVADRLGVPLILAPTIHPAPWLRAVAGRERMRCIFCWRVRLRKTAQFAVRRGFDGYTSSLLYSRHQDHAAIRELGESMVPAPEVAFVYEDFRTSWQEGVRLSKDWGIYRQQYCGCIFSEYDRYAPVYSRSLLP